MEKIYQVTVNDEQYSTLEKMLVSLRAGQLARNQLISGYELFQDIMWDLCTPVTDGWCTYEELIQELNEKNPDDRQGNLLRFLTKQVFPDDEDYFIKQIGKSFHCSKDFSFKIELKF